METDDVLIERITDRDFRFKRKAERRVASNGKGEVATFRFSSE